MITVYAGSPRCRLILSFFSPISPRDHVLLRREGMDLHQHGQILRPLPPPGSVLAVAALEFSSDLSISSTRIWIPISALRASFSIFSFTNLRSWNIIYFFGYSTGFEAVGGLVQSEAMQIFPLTIVSRKELCPEVIQFFMPSPKQLFNTQDQYRDLSVIFKIISPLYLLYDFFIVAFRMSRVISHGFILLP